MMRQIMNPANMRAAMQLQRSGLMSGLGNMNGLGGLGLGSLGTLGQSSQPTPMVNPWANTTPTTNTSNNDDDLEDMYGDEDNTDTRPSTGETANNIPSTNP